MTRRSSNRNKKVPVKFNDMIYDLSTKGTKSKNLCGDDMVKPVENDNETGENGDVTESGIDGGRSKEGIEEVAECLGMGRKTCEATRMDPNSSNVSKSGNDDFPSPSFSLCEKLIEKQGNLTDINDKGEEVVIFDKDLVNEESEKWKFTICGYFVGSSLPIYEMKYNIKRMWGKHGLNDIVVDKDEICFAKFKDEERMNLVIEQSPWMLFNVPLEAWSTKGISTISSRLGRPIMMDKMTADMCNRGNKGKSKDEFTYVRNRKKINGFGGNYNRRQGGNQGVKNGVKTMFVPKVSTAPGKKIMEELKKSANKYVVLAEINEENPKESKGEMMTNKRLIVDEFVKKKIQPSIEEFKDCGYDMIQYFKNAWKAMEKGDNDDNDEEDVEIVYDESTHAVIADEIEGKGSGLMNRGSVGKHPWVEIGNFNVTLKPEEHSNGGSSYNIDMQEFGDIVNKLEVDDLCSTGFYYTWTKSLKNPTNSTLKKLDRILVNDSFISKYCRAHSVFLPYLISNHSPGLLIFLAREWNNVIKGCKMFKVVKKLRHLKNPLNRLNWKHENLFEKANNLKESLQVAQEEVNKDPFNVDKKRKAISILEEYTEVSNDELKLLHQKAKIDWLREGDKNTAYFHNILKARKHKNKVESICDDSKTRFWGNEVAIQIVKHFQNFLGASDQVVPMNQLGIKAHMKLNTEDAEAIIMEVTDKEIREAMFDIDSSKASGPDGGKLLKEVNATLVALVPKVETPNKISDFRPISCCNVLYKCISKILTNRMKNGLSKVGIIESKGLKASFSICINDEVCGYLKNRRGLRQVDPMSPYLFTLVMEVLNMIMIKNIEEDTKFKYHYGCKDLKLTHLCFADDILMLCNGDADSLKVIKKSLDVFSKVSGLFPNHSKSTIFFGSILESKKQELLDVMQFKCGKLPMKYLGVPFLAKRLRVNDCKSLIETVERRINCWRNIMLSYAGRIQLTALVLASMQTYWASVYMLPNSVVMDLEKLFRRKEFVWVKWVNTIKLKNQSIWEVDVSGNDSWGWKNLVMLREKVKPYVMYKIGNGRDISAWHDKWCSIGPLDKFLSNMDIYDVRIAIDAKVVDIISNGRWNWPEGWVEDFPKLNQIPIPVINNGVKDKAIWVNSENKELNFSTKIAWISLRDNGPQVHWNHVVWFSQYNPRQAFILWLAMQKKLMTQDRILKWQQGVILKCPLCNICADNHEHLFFNCSYSTCVWDRLKVKGKMENTNSSLYDVVDKIAEKPSNNNIWKILQRLIVSASVYFIWQERNKRIFQDEKRSTDALCKNIEDNIENMLRALKVKKSRAVLDVANK
ncbi:RNA-directed DNA polymerase, eukaryota, reverse transcriptase zinc-binding domain protein [Tanacetum coccineum]